MKNIVLFGGGLLVHHCIDTIEKEAKSNIIGMTDPYKEAGTDLYGYKVIGRQEGLLRLIGEYDIYGGLITIGDNWNRKHVFYVIQSIKSDFLYVNAIHTAAVLGRGLGLGVGNMVMARGIVSA